jgi:hypothetical protein
MGVAVTAVELSLAVTRTLGRSPERRTQNNALILKTKQLQLYTDMHLGVRKQMTQCSPVTPLLPAEQSITPRQHACRALNADSHRVQWDNTYIGPVRASKPHAKVHTSCIMTGPPHNSKPTLPSKIWALLNMTALHKVDAAQ